MLRQLWIFISASAFSMAWFGAVPAEAEGKRVMDTAHLSALWHMTAREPAGDDEIRALSGARLDLQDEFTRAETMAKIRKQLKQYERDVQTAKDLAIAVGGQAGDYDFDRKGFPIHWPESAEATETFTARGADGSFVTYGVVYDIPESARLARVPPAQARIYADALNRIGRTTESQIVFKVVSATAVPVYPANDPTGALGSTPVMERFIYVRTLGVEVDVSKVSSHNYTSRGVETVTLGGQCLLKTTVDSAAARP